MIIYMIFLLFLVGAETSNNTTASIYNLSKCCEVGSVFVHKNNSYVCEKRENNSVFIKMEYISNTSESYYHQNECIESVNSSLYVFNVTDYQPLIVKNITNKLFPKCCPLGFVYVLDQRSCERSTKMNYFDNDFIKIGLQQCKIIVDFELNSDDIIIREDNNKLLLLNMGENIPSGEYCVDETSENTTIVRVCKSYSICEEIRCIHKCCPDGQSFINGSHCRSTYVNGMNFHNLSQFIANVSDKFAIIHGYDAPLHISPASNFHLDDRGYYHTYTDKIGNRVYPPYEQTYCIEHATKNGIIFGHKFFRMFPKFGEFLDRKFVYNRWAMVVSSIFLLITIGYYIITKEIAKVFGKSLISYCIALLIVYIVLIYSTYKPNLNRRKTMTECKTIAFFFIYMGNSCFAWLQIMSYDIYWTFGSLKQISTAREKRKRNLKRFIFYSIYGWGLPLLLTVIPLAFHYADILPNSINVRIGITKCSIERGDGNYADIIFRSIPVTIIQIINIVLFISTVRYCLKVKEDIHKMSDNQKKKNKFLARKRRFVLTIKLSVIMGISHLFEVISSFYDFKQNSVTEHIEIIWDVINCLQGLFIFIIFICKKKYFRSCKKNITIEKIRKISLTTSTTKTTSLPSSVKKDTSKKKFSREEARNGKLGYRY